MKNRSAERYIYFLLESKSPVYLKETAILDSLSIYPHFHINNNLEKSLNDLNQFLIENVNANKLFLILDVTKMNSDDQKKLLPLVKDKKYQTLILPDNCKIVVTGEKDKVNKELFGLLVVVNV